jgi:2,3-dihydroxybenzoate decarboxylase
MQPDAQTAVADARAANDFLAIVISEHPGRFLGLAAVPLQDPRQAAAELRRAVEELGLCGALVNDHTLGHYLDEPQYEPFWETLQDHLGVALYIHPNPVPSNEWKVLQGYPGLEHGTWSWNHRTGGHALRLIFGGVFDKFPGARIILGHMGEFLPAQLFRIDLRYRDLDPKLQKQLKETALGVLRDEHRDHHVRRVLAPGANRRDPDDRHRQRDVRHRLPVRVK